MPKFPVLQSPDKRVHRTVTSEEELEEYRELGYTAIRANTDTSRGPLDSGAEGNQRARASSTTEGSERNTGSTTPPVKK